MSGVVIDLAEWRRQGEEQRELPKTAEPRWLFNADIYEPGAEGQTLMRIKDFDADDGLSPVQRWQTWAAQMMRATGSIQQSAHELGGDQGQVVAVVVVTDRKTRVTAWPNNLKLARDETLWALMATAFTQLTEMRTDEDEHG